MAVEGEQVLVRDDQGEEWRTGTVLVVGWQTGTYRVQVGRRKRHVSMTQVTRPDGTPHGHPTASEEQRAARQDTPFSL